MTPELVTDLVRNALFVSLEICGPLLLLALVVGFAISIFQSVTQINEMTLTFVPKILIFVVALVILFPWMLKVMVNYTMNLLVNEWDKLVSFSTYTS